jgi:VWFA-related protein
MKGRIVTRLSPREIAKADNRSIRLARGALATFGVAAVLWCGTSPAPSGQQAHAGSDADSIRSTSSAVDIYAIVEGRHAQLVRGLTQDDFEVRENSIRENIIHFSSETDVALNLGVAIDTSASQSNLLHTEQEAAKKFLRTVLASRDQAFVMNFDVDVNLLRDFTNVTAELVNAVDSARINQTGKSVLAQGASATGGTHLYDAVYLASNELMKSRAGRKVLVLVTDGEDQGSKIDLDKTIESAEKADVVVYTIVVSDPRFYALMGGTYQGDASVRKLARQTGGRTIRLQSVEQIGDAFDQIDRELRAQYLLGYFPSDLRGDGSFRRIQVRVRGHNYAVRARAGYYDQRPAHATTSVTR